MDRPWINPEDVKNYSESEKVKARADGQLAFDIARAEKYIIFHTNNKFDSEEYSDELPSDVRMAVILLAEAYAKQSILKKEGNISSETFDDYSYTLNSETDIADSLGLEHLLDEYVLEKDSGKVIMKMRKL